jgi:glycosyltransferase involved in cell wall biosynthesis
MKNNLNKISVVIIVKNGAETINDVLESLLNFDDIVIYDNGSTDGTQKVVNRYKNTNLIIGEFLGFGPTKNKAATYSKYDWVLSLDADEVVSLEMLEDIINIDLNENYIYEIKRYNYYKNKRINYCGWGEERIVRFYNKSVATFNNSMVHEKITVGNLNLKTINGELKHYPYNSLSQFVQKADHYSTLFARDKVGIKSSSPLKAFLNATFSFIKTYIFKRGFLDGYIGLVISVSHAMTNFFKYMKLYELNKELKK